MKKLLNEKSGILASDVSEMFGGKKVEPVSIMTNPVKGLNGQLYTKTAKVVYEIFSAHHSYNDFMHARDVFFKPNFNSEEQIGSVNRKYDIYPKKSRRGVHCMEVEYDFSKLSQYNNEIIKKIKDDFERLFNTYFKSFHCSFD